MDKVGGLFVFQEIDSESYFVLCFDFVVLVIVSPVFYDGVKIVAVGNICFEKRWRFSQSCLLHPPY